VLPHRRLGPIWIAALLLTISIAACDSSDNDSDLERWRLDWQRVTSVVPEQSELGDPPDQDVCRSALAEIRAVEEDLPPAPTEGIDKLSNEWVAIAEETFFECPPQGPDIDSVEDAYGELQRIEDAIQAALDDA
jgi:hypothetical protein